MLQFSVWWCEGIHTAGALQWGLEGIGGERQSANECGRCRVGQLAGHCGRAQWGLKGMQEDVLGPRGGTGKGDSSSWQIACLCGSQRPYISFPLVPISPRLVFHPCPSGCNGVPGCLDGWRCGHYWQPWLERHSFLSGSPKTWVIAVHHTGEMWPSSGVSLILPVVLAQFLTTLFSHFCPFLSCFSMYPRLFTFFPPLVPFSHLFFPSFSALCYLTLFTKKPDTLR